MTNLSWVRLPQQARSQDTLARLLDAAEQLLEEQPWDAITVQQLVGRGKSSVGAFYARFTDKDALLQHLHQRRSAEAIETANAALALERWQGVPLADVVAAVVAFVAHDYQQHAGLHREIVRRNSVDARFRERSADVAGHVTRLIKALLDVRKEDVAAKDTLRAADMCHRMLFSILDQHVQFADRPPGAVALSTEELVASIASAILGVLRQP